MDAGVYKNSAEGFAELADTYDARLAGNSLYLLESTETLAALPDLAGKVVADVGCGTGRYALQMARMGADTVQGMDFVPEMLVVAARKARTAELPIQWMQGDLLTGLPLDDNALDVAVCAVVLSFLPELTAPLDELSRVLRPGGVLIVSDYHPQGLSEVRAAAVGFRDSAPYFRFTATNGEEYRLAQYVYQISDLFIAATRAGLLLEHLAEPLCDRRLANTYTGLRDKVGIPLALVARFRKQ